MSTDQYAAIFASRPSPETLVDPTFHFYHLVYDCPIQFQEKYPNAVMVGCGGVKDWAFHINTLDEANIRPFYKAEVTPNADYLLPSPSIKDIFDSTKKPFSLFGIIFKMTDLKDKTLLAKEGGGPGDRMRISLDAEFYNPEIRKCLILKVTTFMDIRNTLEGCKRVVHTQAYLDFWTENFSMMVNHGISKMYVQRLVNQLLGRSISLPQPLYVAPTDPIAGSMAPPPRRSAPAPSHEFPFTPESVGVEEFTNQYNGMIAMVNDEEIQSQLRDEMELALEKHWSQQAGQSRKRTRRRDEDDEGVARSAARPTLGVFRLPGAKIDPPVSEEEQRRQVEEALRALVMKSIQSLSQEQHKKNVTQGNKGV